MIKWGVSKTSFKHNLEANSKPLMAPHTMCDLSICNKPLISFFHQEWGYILSTGMGCIEREVRGLALKEQSLWTSIMMSDRLTGKNYRQECTVWIQLWDPALLNSTNDEKESPMLCFWLMIMLAMQECDSSCSISCSSPMYKAITSATWLTRNQYRLRSPLVLLKLDPYLLPEAWGPTIIQMRLMLTYPSPHYSCNVHQTSLYMWFWDYLTCSAVQYKSHVTFHITNLFYLVAPGWWTFFCCLCWWYVAAAGIQIFP